MQLVKTQFLNKSILMNQFEFYLYLRIIVIRQLIVQTYIYFESLERKAIIKMKSISNNNQQVCSVCEAQPEDMLILSCRHNLCLQCATEVYNLNSKQDKILCEMCLSDTLLDQETIVCLRSLSAKQIKQHQQQPLHYIALTKQENYQPFPAIPKGIKSTKANYIESIPMITDDLLPLSSSSSSLTLCDKHQQPLTYFCMDCNNFRICSQCMLLDNHRFHKVITLKKAILQVKQTIQRVINQKQRLKNILQKDKQSLIVRRQQSEKQLQLNINELKSAFEEINKIVLERYNQLAREIEEDGRRKLQIMSGAVNQIDQKINLIEETVQFEQELIQSTSNSNNTLQGAMQMFEYYEKEIAQQKVDFEPSLPNFISQVTPVQLAQKEQLFSHIQSLLEDLNITLSSENFQHHNDDEQPQINYMSQIDPLDMQQRELQSQKDKNFNKRKHSNHNSYKKQPLIQQQMYHFIPQQHYPGHQHRKPVSQNINIIQLSANKPKQTIKPSQSKVSKQTIQAIKKKARENLKDRQLSQSRKMELSRSISNATDILNKIQQRSSRI